MKTRRSRWVTCLVAAAIALWFAAVAGGSFQLPRYHDVVQDLRGNAISGASVYVYNANTSTLATLYTTPSSSGPRKSNPLTTDSSGRFWFYAQQGFYDLRVSRVGMTTYTLEDVGLVVSWPDTITFAGRIASLDTVAEATAGAGVVVAGSLVKGATFYADTLRGKSGATVNLGASGVTILSKTVTADTLQGTAGTATVEGDFAVHGTVFADTITAKTASGVRIGGARIRSKTLYADSLSGRSTIGVALSTNVKARVNTLQADSLTANTAGLLASKYLFVNGLQFHSGSIIKTTALKSTSYTLTVADEVIVFYGQTGNVYATLPVMSTPGAVAANGRVFTIINADPTATDSVFVEASGAELLNGSALRKAYILTGGGYKGATFIHPHESIGWITMSAYGE